MRAETELLLLDDRAGNDQYHTLIELARITMDNGRYTDANDYFVRAFDAHDRAQIDKKGPVEYAFVLNEYARSLAQAGGHQDADKARQCSAALIAANPDQKVMPERMPYRETCVKA